MTKQLEEKIVKPWLPDKWDYEADVVVVGYGGAGACAAIAAYDAGVTPLVLEKAPFANGGNTGCCYGGNIAVYYSTEDAIDYLRAMCWGTVTDEELIHTFVLTMNDLPGWLESLGMPLYYKKGFATSPTLPGSIACAEGQELLIDVDGMPGNGKDLFAFIKSCVDARGIKVMLETRAKELIQDAETKEILGVKAITVAGKEIYVKAGRGVVLACGGFENNPDMIHQFCMSHSHSLFIPTMGTPYNTGDGIYMATAVGAKLWHMNCAEIYHVCAKVPSEIYGVGIGHITEDKCIWVNRYGKRFMNEKCLYRHSHTKASLPIFHFTHELKSYTGRDFADYQNVPFYIIFDETLRKEGPIAKVGHYGYAIAHKVYEWSEDNRAEIAKGWIIKADTIEELGSKIVCKDFFGRVVGMNAAGLVEAVNKYNQYCAAGEDPDFGRLSETLIPIKTPPFYAM